MSKTIILGAMPMYRASSIALNDNDAASLGLDINGNLLTREGFAPGYEDNVANVAKVEQRFSYAAYTTAQTATTIKTGAGFLHTISILGGTAGAITVWDQTSGASPIILGPFTPGNVTVPVTLLLDVSFATGLTFTTAAATVI